MWSPEATGKTSKSQAPGAGVDSLPLPPAIQRLSGTLAIRERGCDVPKQDGGLQECDHTGCRVQGSGFRVQATGLGQAQSVDDWRAPIPAGPGVSTYSVGTAPPKYAASCDG